MSARRFPLLAGLAAAITLAGGCADAPAPEPPGGALSAKQIALDYLRAMPEGVRAADARFSLHNACRPFGLFVEHLPEAARDYGLSEGLIRTPAAMQILFSGLPAPEEVRPDTREYLYVQVNVLPKPYPASLSRRRSVHVHMAFKKTLHDPDSGESSYADTWKMNWLGAGSRQHLLDRLPELIQFFIGEYQAANPAGCGAMDAAPGQPGPEPDFAALAGGDLEAFPRSEPAVRGGVPALPARAVRAENPN